MKKLSSERLKELFKDHEPMLKALEESFDDIIEALVAVAKPITSHDYVDNPKKTPNEKAVLLADIERLRGERDHYRNIAQAIQNNPAEDNKAYIKGFQDGFREGAKFASEESK